MLSLPIDEHIPTITATVREHRAVVVVAAPGAGKTTRVPPALADDGPVILLQPRRVAARSIARRIAAERGWTVGREVGWQVRGERRFDASTRLLVATEGVLIARLQSDPLLSDFRTAVVDEFHERSIHADIGLALARQAMLARDDLRIVVMSATIDGVSVAAFLGSCPIVEVPGRTFPLDISYRPGVAVEDAVLDDLPRTRGAILCFLPGAPEIRRAQDRLETALRERGAHGVDVLPLYGALDGDAQDAALTPNPDGRARVILATNIAETTLTVPDVTCVVDSGLQKVARYDAERGIDGLTTERVSQDSADQRAGRAGRVQQGRVVRLWDARDRLRPHREPEIARVDLAPVALDVIVWGGDPRRFEWYEAPRADRLEAALDLLVRLGLITPGGSPAGSSAPALTSAAEAIRRLPLHPRLGRMLIESGGAFEMALACALLSERPVLPLRHATTACDLLSAVDNPAVLPERVRRVAREIHASTRHAPGARTLERIDEEVFRRAVLAGYPDRVAKRREPGSDRFLLASGSGARIARESGVRDAGFVVAVDVARSDAAGADALVRIATAVDRAWLVPTSTSVEHSLDVETGVVRAWEVDRYDAIELTRRPVAPDLDAAAELISAELIRRGPDDAALQLVRRLGFAGFDAEASFETLVRRAAVGATRLSDVDLMAAIPYDVRSRLDRDAPERLPLPSGRTARLEYRADGTVSAAAKLQELFGLAETPRLGPNRAPVTFELLSPAGRPVQVTSDLRSFWTRGYPEVRRELRARYPKHPWPEDPWTATPTHRTTRRS